MTYPVLQFNEQDQQKIIFTINQLARGLNNSQTSIIANVIANGVTDDAAAINAAIKALPALGGTVFVVLPAGATTIAIANTIFIGDANTATKSTQNGIRLVFPGFGADSTEAFGFGSSSRPGVTLKWTGASSTPMVKVRGPLTGWGIENVTFDGNSTSGLVGLEIVSASDGYCASLNFVGCPTSIYSHCLATHPYVALANSMHNIFMDTTIHVPGGGIGIFLDGFEDTVSNSCVNHFHNTSISDAGTPPGIGLKLGACDSNSFWGLHDNCTTGVAFDYTLGFGAWPASNIFYTADVAFGFTNTGTPGANCRPNLIDGLVETNGGLYPVLANLSIIGLPTSVWRIKLTGQTGAIASQNVPIQLAGAPANAGPQLILVSYYVVMTQVGTGGGFSMRFFWNDPATPLGGPTQQITTAFLNATILGNYISGSFVAYPGASPMVWDVLSTATGTPNYTLAISFERLS